MAKQTKAKPNCVQLVKGGALHISHDASLHARDATSSTELRSSRPKVISPEVMSPENRVMSPEIYSHVARYFESCRPNFHNAQKDSKNASQSEM